MRPRPAAGVSGERGSSDPGSRRHHTPEEVRDVTTPPDGIILSARNLAKQFAGFMAVSGVDLDVARGSIHALIGPNGAGKTTCFNLLTKFLQPTSGSITFNGRDISSMAPARPPHAPADIARLGSSAPSRSPRSSRS